MEEKNQNNQKNLKNEILKNPENNTEKEDILDLIYKVREEKIDDIIKNINKKIKEEYKNLNDEEEKENINKKSTINISKKYNYLCIFRHFSLAILSLF